MKVPLRVVADVATLRGVTSFSSARMYWVLGTNQIFKYDKNSMAVDDGVTIVKPTSVNVLNPGRWLLSISGAGAGGGNGSPLRFSFPGVLNITENAYIPPASPDHAVTITKLAAFVKTPSVGASIIVTFKKITLATGVLSASIGTVTIAAGAWYAETVVAVALATTEGLVMEITQVGSVNTEGQNLTGWGIAA